MERESARPQGGRVSSISPPPARARAASFATALLLAAGVLAGTAARAAAAPLAIAADTTWQGAVAVDGEVRVLPGATLLILPGTTVRFSAERDEAGSPKARLVVNGTLVAQGTPGEPIVFTSAAREPAPGDWGGIAFEMSKERANRIQHARVEHAVAGVTGTSARLVIEDALLTRNLAGVRALRDFSGVIAHSSVTGNEVGIHYQQNSDFRTEHCEVTGNGQGGIACITNSSPTVRNSTIADNGPEGVVCIQGSSPLLEGNTIRGHQRGVYLEFQSRPRVVRNLITGNEAAIWGEKLVFPLVQGNVITGNKTGIYCNYSAYMVIRENNIFDNGSLSLVLGDNMSILMEKKIPFRQKGQFFMEKPPEVEPLPEQNRKYQPFTASDEGIVDARGNWWGAAATGEMERLGEGGNISVIEDFRDKPDTYFGEEVFRRDRVVFAPWEKAPLKEAGPAEISYSGVRGKIIFGGKPLAGVRVHAYRDAAEAFRGEGVSYSAPSAADGTWSLRLAPGAWFLVAKGPLPLYPHAEPGGDAYFGYSGSNPVQVSAGAFAVSNIQVVRRRSPVEAASGDPGASRIEGVVLGPQGPVAGAAVHVYADAARQFRGPDLFGPQGAVADGTDAKGAFSFEVPPGTYFLVASKRKGGEMLGPLQPGDLHGYFDGNPVELRAGAAAAVTIQVVEKLREAVAPAAPQGGTGIRGKILDTAGKVPPGVYAFATTDPSFMIGAMPPYRSRPLGADGSFSIDLPAGGTYYVSARSGYGGPPLPGEWHGFYGEKTPRAIVVETNRVTEGIDFVIRKME